MAGELRWILLGLSVLLLAGIWWWGTRRSRQAPGNAQLRESPLHAPAPAQMAERREADGSSDWGVPPFEPLNIRRADFDPLPILDTPMTAASEPDVILDLHDVECHAVGSVAAPRDPEQASGGTATRHEAEVGKTSDWVGSTELPFADLPAEPYFAEPPADLPPEPYFAEPAFDEQPLDPPFAEPTFDEVTAELPFIQPPPVRSPPPTEPPLAKRPPVGTPPAEPPSIESRTPIAPPSASPENSGRFTAATPQTANVSETQRIVTVRVCAQGEERWAGVELMAALEKHGLSYGRYKVFHRNQSDGRTLFCAASLSEPGTFNIAQMPEEEFRGLTLFAVLPGPIEPLQIVDALIVTAAELAETLHGTVQDSKGMPLSAQRAEALRGEVTRFQASLTMI